MIFLEFAIAAIDYHYTFSVIMKYTVHIESEKRQRKTAENTTERMRDMYCNACGRELKMEHGMLLEDAFEARKQWGYFSKKDTQMHSFVLCEKCYDQMVERFVCPPKVTEVTEL